MKIILVASLVMTFLFSACKSDDPDPVSKSSSKAIELFSFNTINAVVDAAGKTIKAEVPSGTDLTKLSPTITTSGKALVSPASGTTQDFSKPVVYTVTAEDGSTQAYIVTVTYINNGTVYIGNLDGVFYAVDALTGTEKWKFQAGGAIEATPVVVDGVVYIASWDKKLYALDAMTGAKKWEVAPGLIQPFAAAAVEKGLVYYPGDHKLFAIDVTTGAVKWEYQDDEVYGWQASPTLLNGTVYASIRGTGPRVGIYGLDAVSGSKKWKAAKTHITESSPAIANSILYAGSEYEGFNAFDLATGALKWNFAEASVVNSSPTVSNGLVYIGSGNKKAYALDAITGTKKWEFLTGENTVAYSSPIVSNGILYIGSGSKLYAIDAVTGVKKWDAEPEQNTLIYSGAVVANTVLYIGIGKKLYSFDAATGAKKWEFLTSRTISESSPCVLDKDGKSYQAGISGMVQ